MKIDDPLEDLKKAAHEAGLNWSIIKDSDDVLDSLPNFRVRKLREPKDKSKLSRQDLITKTAHGQANVAGIAWGDENISGFKEARMAEVTIQNYNECRIPLHVVEAFRKAAMSRCEVEYT